jgi:ribose transport system substrate-binding protein
MPEDLPKGLSVAIVQKGKASSQYISRKTLCNEASRGRPEESRAGKKKIRRVRQRKSCEEVLGMKKILMCALILFCAGALVFATGTTEKGAKAGTKKGLVIGFAGFFTGNSWNNQCFSSIEKAAAQDPEIASLVVANADANVEKQIAQINDMVDKHVDAIVVMAASDTAENPVLDSAVKAGIPVVTSDHYVTSNNLTCQIYVDQLQWGRVTAQWLVDKLGPKGGNIVVLNGVAGNADNNGRWGGAKEVFDKHPEIKILAMANADWDQAKAQPVVASWLAAYPQIDGVWSQGGAMTAAAMIEFQKAGRKLVPMVGEAYNGFMKMWIKNQPDGFSSLAPVQPNFDVQIALEVAKRAAKGQKVPVKISIPLVINDDKTVANTVVWDMPDDYWPVNWLPADKVNEIIEQASGK